MYAYRMTMNLFPALEHCFMLSMWSCNCGWVRDHFSSMPLAFETSPRTSAMHWNCSANDGAKVSSNKSGVSKHSVVTWSRISFAKSAFFYLLMQKHSIMWVPQRRRMESKRFTLFNFSKKPVKYSGRALRVLNVHLSCSFLDSSPEHFLKSTITLSTIFLNSSKSCWNSEFSTALSITLRAHWNFSKYSLSFSLMPSNGLKANSSNDSDGAADTTCQQNRLNYQFCVLVFCTIIWSYLFRVNSLVKC